jgi:hypothetical protein
MLRDTPQLLLQNKSGRHWNVHICDELSQGENMLPSMAFAIDRRK